MEGLISFLVLSSLDILYPFNVLFTQLVVLLKKYHKLALDLPKYSAASFIEENSFLSPVSSLDSKTGC